MKKTFQKTLIAAAAGVALMSAVGTASANSLLFPYFTTVSGAQSVLSLSNTGTTPANQVVHYVYNYSAAGSAAACTHFDANGSLTANDILSHSIAAPGAAGGFGKVVGSDTSNPVYFPLAGQVGFLTVSSKTTSSTDALRGSMAIVDPASGLVVSYPGIDNGLDTQAAAGEGNYAAITDLNFPLATMPAAAVTTSWYAVVVGDMSSVIAASADWRGSVTLNNNGFVYNNDEVPFSGTVTRPITCSATVVPTELMNSAQAAAVGTNGALIRSRGVVTSTGANLASGLVMMKMQTVQPAVGAPFAGRQFLHREQAGM